MEKIMSNCETNMQKTVKVLENDFAAVRAGRANPAILDKVRVDYYGVPTPINQLAAISVPEARLLLIQPWDVSSIKSIEKAIQVADIGIMPQNDGKVIRLSFPPLTEDRRKELVKSLHKMAEDSKVAVRNIRRNTIEELKSKKKANEITEDELRANENEVQKLTDKYCKAIDELLEKKEQEILEV